MIVKSLDELSKGNLLTLWTIETRPTNPTVGYIGRNTELGVVETWDGSNWVLVGGGATGGGADTVFVETSYNVTTNYTLTAGKSAMTVGDASGNVTIADGVEITIPTGSQWNILGGCDMGSFGFNSNGTFQINGVPKIAVPTKVSPSSILVDGTVLSLDTNLDTGSKVAGTDYYFTKTLITENKNLAGVLGGFHYGVIPEAFTAINNITASDATKIAGINAYSIWTLWSRASCMDNRGMFKANNGKWYDLYLCNVDHHTYGTSAAGKTIAGGAVTNGRNFPKIPLFYGGNGTTTYGTLTWFEAAEIGKAYGKDLISYGEFAAIAYGVLEASSAGAADTGVTQHLANYTSKFGMCMATGCEWIWGKNLYMRPDGTTWAYHTETEGRGSLYAYQNGPTAAVFGGDRDNTSRSGSRASSWSDPVWYSSWTSGCRFACDHLEVM